MDEVNEARVAVMRGLDGLKLRHGVVTFEDRTDEDCTVVGVDVVSKQEVRVKKVPWQGLADWLIEGRYIQDALRSVDADGREFLVTGIGPESFTKLFGEED